MIGNEDPQETVHNGERQAPWSVPFCFGWDENLKPVCCSIVGNSEMTVGGGQREEGNVMNVFPVLPYVTLLLKSHS